MKVLLLGSAGQLGSEFKNFLKDKVELYAYTHKEVDITDLNSIKETFQEIYPEIVINCAAYTNVDKAEEDEELAYKVNSIGARNISFLSFKVGAKVVYFSTDYVFDGKNSCPYREFDEPNPLSIYGKTKLLGEIYTRQHNPNHLILRISWLYGINGVNFAKKIVKLSKEKKEIKVVNDQIGTPTYSLDVVKQTWRLIQMDSVGLYHSANLGESTWFEFAKIIVNMLNLNAIVIPVSSNEFKTPAKRPKFSVLDNYLLNLEGKNIMRDWKNALIDFINNFREELI